MTFKHKLSRRLALLKDALPLAVLLLVSCEIARRNPTGADGELSVLHIVPNQVSLQPSQTWDFIVVGFSATGDTIDAPVLWSATAGSIVDTGRVNGRHYGRYKAAPDTGRVKVIARGKSGAVADTANVLVALASVAAVNILPPAATIPTGGTVQLIAAVRDSAGNLLARPVSWSASSGIVTVDGTGLVTGVAEGSATINATSEGQSATSSITVTAAPVPGTCNTSSLAWLNTAFTAQTGSFTVQFDATPNGPSIDGVTGLSQGPAAANTDLAAIVRFNTLGQIDARNGGAYAAANAIAYTAATSYRFRLVVDIPTHTYSAYVTPFGSTEVTIGTGFAFRTEQNAVTSLANGALHANAGAHAVCNLSITSSTPPVPVASVEVTPASASIQVWAAVPLTATAKDANGNALVGRTITWASSAPSVATVSPSGLVSGVAVGSATVTATSEGQSGTSAITVTEPQPPTTGSCLSLAGPTITLSGARSPYDNGSVSSNTKIDARTATWTGSDNHAVRYGGGSNICWSGGRITGTFPDGTSWSAYHDAYSMLIRGSPGTVIEGVRIHNYGDGPNFDDAGSEGWTVRGNHLSYIHDDCLSNDFGNTGLLEDNLFDGCYVGYSSRAYTGVGDNRSKVVTIRNNLWRLQHMPTSYNGTPGHGRFWKMNSSDGSGTDPRIALHNNIFRMDEHPVCCGNFLIPPAAYLASCSNNIMVWLGSGDFPEPIPSCFTLTRDKAVWDNAVADWQSRHPNISP